MEAAHLDRFFGVKQRGGRRVEPSGGGAVLMGGDTHTLPKLVVNACQYGGEYPYCDPPPIEWDQTLPPKEVQVCYTDCGGGGGGPGGDSPEPPPLPEEEPKPCNTSDPVINDDNVEAGFDRIWTASNPDAADQMLRREKGGFIIQTPNGMVVQDFPAEWTSGPCEISIPDDAQAPPGTIGIIHTHPWRVGEEQISCGPVARIGGKDFYQNYPGTFTEHDQDTLAQWGKQLGRTLTGYILDKDGIRRFHETSSVPDSFERCAY